MKKSIISQWTNFIFRGTLLTIAATVLAAGFAFAGTKPLRYLSGQKKNFLSTPSVDLFHRSTNLFAKKSGGEGAFGEGKLVLTGGYGYGGGLVKLLLKTYEDENAYSFSGFGPVHFRGEFGLSDNIGLVLSVNHNSWKATWTHTDGVLIYYDEFKRSVISFLGRINVHFAVNESLDPYWGIGAGYRSANYSFTSTDPGYDTSIESPLNLGFETTFGLRYYLAENFGLYVEMGLAQSIIQGGLALKF